MKNFKLIFTLSIALTINYVSAQLCPEDDRFTNSEYFSIMQIDSLKNVNYGNALHYKGEDIDLNMDIYFPNNSIDTMELRPFILLVHGGGFQGGNREGYSYMSREFAKRGFVTATMSYRLGFDESDDIGLIKAIYRAQQDANQALSYVAANTSSLKINNSWIFIGGSSAGAITSLLTSYADQEEWEQAVPGIESILGPLRPNGNDFKQTFVISGIYNHMGAIQPIALDVEDLIPTISFHGQLDQAVPIGISASGFGSIPLHNMLNDASVCNDLTIVPEGGHDVYITDEGIDFSINKVACFFKSLFCDTCTSFRATEDVPANCAN